MLSCATITLVCVADTIHENLGPGMPDDENVNGGDWGSCLPPLGEWAGVGPRASRPQLGGGCRGSPASAGRVRRPAGLSCPPWAGRGRLLRLQGPFCPSSPQCSPRPSTHHRRTECRTERGTAARCTGGERSAATQPQPPSFRRACALPKRWGDCGERAERACQGSARGAQAHCSCRPAPARSQG